MRFKGLDLNLLVVLDALLTEKNVSRAGEVLHLSQSATSSALARLREYFDDELLVPQGRVMVPTALGSAMAPQIRNALLQIDGTIIARPDFDPATARREVKIIASDYVAIAWLAPMIAKISLLAPGLRFRIEPPTNDPASLLDAGQTDLLLMPEKYLSESHPSAVCFEDTYCVIAWSGNDTIGTKITEEDFFSMPHVDAAFPTIVPGYSDWFMRQGGKERRVDIMAGGFSNVPYFVVGTNRIALVHRRLAESYATHLPIKIMPEPFEIPSLVECLQWHRFAQEDACLAWVRAQILE